MAIFQRRSRLLSPSQPPFDRFDKAQRKVAHDVCVGPAGWAGAAARRGWGMTGGNSACPFGGGAVAEAAGAAAAAAGGKFITFLNQGPLAEAAAPSLPPACHAALLRP